MTEIGKIVKVKDGVALVRFFRKGECDRCLMCSTTKDGSQTELSLKNTLDLNVGDYVKVEVYKKKNYVMSILVYALPLLLAALGAGLGSLAGLATSILLGIAGIVVGLAFALPIDICVLRKNGAPKMIEVSREIDYLNAKPKQDSKNDNEGEN
ncbi:MAG: SoxR reducing system RseC family protein [Bacteroides sp.]|nr:SoxR reducing system RseC family protein [Bacillota bacterium]MCM1393425.1 SoxR reducing system RseC family protein [[Eubacterium] siraeum]MCM1455174.1 SoxR reducing system RseC family protein [Bacteroides sp.]